jgi:hypothetical protein
VQRGEALKVVDLALNFGCDFCGFGKVSAAVDYPYAGAFNVFCGDLLFFF